MPRSVRTLVRGEPRIGAFGVGVSSADVECHGGLDVIPRIGEAALVPEDQSTRQLQRRDAFDTGRQIGRSHRGFRAYMIRLFPRIGLSILSAIVVTAGRFVRSQTKKSW